MYKNEFSIASFSSQMDQVEGLRLNRFGFFRRRFRALSGFVDVMPVFIDGLLGIYEFDSAKPADIFFAPTLEIMSVTNTGSVLHCDLNGSQTARKKTS
jgi:hypothetical protein